MMKLTDLSPEFMRTLDDADHRMCACSFEAAQGVMFLCPACFKKNGGEVGTHEILVWFADKGVHESWSPTPRWVMTGTGMHDLTLSPSIDVKGCWHGFIRQGEIVNA